MLVYAFVSNGLLLQDIVLLKFGCKQTVPSFYMT